MDTTNITYDTQTWKCYKHRLENVATCMEALG